MTYGTTITFTENTSWQCPANVYCVDLKLRGGGGGGGAGGDSERHNYNGGYAGAYTEASLVAVTPGNYYSIVIGNGGAALNYEREGFPGGATIALGYTAAGGAGGDEKTGGPGPGQNGGPPAGGGAGLTGGSPTFTTGGTASGGGGGGGGSSNSGLGYYTTIDGGAGGKGVATIEYTLPTADFTGTPLSGQLPVTTTWTNLSTDATSYYWNFGNSTSSSDTNPSPTTYNTSADFTVTLTATGLYGIAQKVRTGYVKVSRIPYSCSFLIMSDNLRGV